MAKLWGSRFGKTTNPLVDKFTSSIIFDQKLAKYDVIGSIAHAKMLGKSKIISHKDSRAIVKGLKSILVEIEKRRFKFDATSEDIHSNIADLLFKKIGQVANKLHTARSRNDQVALDVKMYCKDEISRMNKLITGLQKTILNFADKNKAMMIPAYTHLQPAQVVLLAHHLLAYIEMLERDKGRLCDAAVRLDTLPLGSCALSGTTLPIDRAYVARELKFKSVSANSIDAVSDRDFIIEILSSLSILSVHLSRIAEDLILWSTHEFNFIEIDFSFCTGSSIMPHKKNPDILELIRASVGKVHGDLSSVLIMMKGLPLSYNRDMQLDKPPLFNGVETVSEILTIFIELFKNIKINKDIIAEKIMDESLFSVDIVDYLIKKGASYREAHDIVGRMVKDCLDRGKNISSLSPAQLNSFSHKLGADVKNILNAWASVSRKQSFGSTNPLLVSKQMAKWKSRLK